MGAARRLNAPAADRRGACYEPCGGIVDVGPREKSLFEFLIAFVAFLSLTGAAYLGRLAGSKAGGATQDRTSEVVRLIANLFVVMTSLALGLMLNSAKNALETNNRNIHALATQIILLDRTLRALGPEAGETRRQMAEYLQISLKETNILEEDPKAEAALDAAGTTLRAIKVADEQKVALWNDARFIYRQVVQQRWMVVDAAGWTIPTPLIVMLVLWLVVIFASFGYRAPSTVPVAVSLALGAALVCGALYLILDMDTPASGYIQTSNAPFQKALTQLQR